MLETFSSLVTTLPKMKASEVKTDPEMANTLTEKPPLSHTVTDQGGLGIKGLSFGSKLFFFVVISALCGLVILQQKMLVNERMVSEQLRQEILRIRSTETPHNPKAPAPNIVTRPPSGDLNSKSDGKPIQDLNTNSNTKPTLENPTVYIDGHEITSDLIHETYEENSADGCEKLSIRFKVTKIGSRWSRPSDFPIQTFLKYDYIPGDVIVTITKTLGRFKLDHSTIKTERIPCDSDDDDKIDYDIDYDGDNNRPKDDGDGISSGDNSVDKKPDIEPLRSSWSDYDSEDYWGTDSGSGDMNKFHLENQNYLPVPTTWNENNSSNITAIRLVPDELRLNLLKRFRYYSKPVDPIYWKLAKQRTNSQSYFIFDALESSINISTSGYYRINAQMTFSDNNFFWMSGFGIKVNNFTWTKCIVGEGDNIPSIYFRNKEVAGSDKGRDSTLGQALTHHRPCSTSQTIYLTAHDVVKVECLYGCREVLQESDLTYWGIERVQ